MDKTNGDTKKRLSEKIQELSTAMYKSISSAPGVNPHSSTYQLSANAGGYNPNETSTPAPNTDSVTVDAPSDDSSGYKELNDTALKSLLRRFTKKYLQALMIFVGENKLEKNQN